jgi:hypothetical protein
MGISPRRQLARKRADRRRGKGRQLETRLLLRLALGKRRVAAVGVGRQCGQTRGDGVAVNARAVAAARQRRARLVQRRGDTLRIAQRPSQDGQLVQFFGGEGEPRGDIAVESVLGFEAERYV